MDQIITCEYDDNFTNIFLTYLDACKMEYKSTGELVLWGSFKKPKHIHSWHSTPFIGLHRMSIVQSLSMGKKRILSTQTCFDDGITLNTIGLMLKNAVKEYLGNMWEPDTPKIMYHSSGYDSRIISLCLRELREENGSEWIGELYFLCHEPENQQFVDIMIKEGWYAGQIIPYLDSEMEEDYYDIGNLHNIPNGFVPYTQQLDIHSRFMKEHDLKEKDCILIMGLEGGEWFDYPARKLKPSTKEHHCENFALNRWINYHGNNASWVSKYISEWKKCIFPFMSWEYIKVASKVPEEYIKRSNKNHLAPDNVREAILKQFDLDLSAIPYVGHDYQWNMSEDRKAEMTRFYVRSKFFRDHGIELTEDVFDNPAGWESRMWSLALIYEKALEGNTNE